MTEEKVRENKLRRTAERRGLRLEKSRRRDPRAIDYGRYWLYHGDAYNPADDNWRSRALVFGDFRTGADLDEVEEFLSR